MSSGEAGFGLIVAEKFFGLLLLVVGALATYYSWLSANALRDYSGFFGLLGVIILLLGIFLLIARPE